MNITIGHTTYRSLQAAADAYGTNVSTLAHYRRQIKNHQRLERFLVLSQLQQLLANQDVSDETADYDSFELSDNVLGAPSVGPMLHLNLSRSEGDWDAHAQYQDL